MIKQELFGKTSLGEEVYSYTLENESGVRVVVLSWGGVIKSIEIPDKNGNLTDVVLGYDDMEGYEKGSSYFGAFIGRYGNRIINSTFDLNGKTYTLEANNGPNHLHGPFARRVLESAVVGDSVVMTLISPPEEEGYPGTLKVSVKYTLTENSGLVIDYDAESDEDTPVNLTNHSYFNLNGEGGTIKDLTLRMIADRFTPCGKGIIPTGEIASVEGTPFDFRQGQIMEEAIFGTHPQVEMCRGIDHNLIFPENSGTMKHFATLSSQKTGIKMDCYTTEIAVQLYTGNSIVNDKAPFGKGKKKYENYGALCLETQHYPASPNFSHFPSTILKKGDKYRSTTEYRFSVEK